MSLVAANVTINSENGTIIILTNTVTISAEDGITITFTNTVTTVIKATGPFSFVGIGDDGITFGTAISTTTIPVPGGPGTGSVTLS